MPDEGPLRLLSLEVQNWRNFKSIALPIGQRLFVYGPNASGKSNFLDVLRFLRDVARSGGGLQQAVLDRDGLSKVRFLGARNHLKSHVRIKVEIGAEPDGPRWSYELRFGVAKPGVAVEAEVVRRVETPGGPWETKLDRPNANDEADPALRSQTHLEQVSANREFRRVAEYLQSLVYLDPLPRLIQDPREPRNGESDHGAGLIREIARTNKRERDWRFHRIESLLGAALPQFSKLELVQDDDGIPHLQASFEQWRKSHALHQERDLSAGTLRLFAILWALHHRTEAGRTILLEEPENSLHAELVRQIPQLISKACRSTRAQVIMSTHALRLLDDPGVGLNEILMLKPSDDGTEARLADADEDVVAGVLKGGLTPYEALRSDLSPDALGLFAPRWRD